MSVLGDKGSEILLGVSITGLVSTVVWLLKWCDRLDLECHDLRRDVNHLQRDNVNLSNVVSNTDKEYDANSIKLNQYFHTTNARFIHLEGRLNSLYSRRSNDIDIKPED